MLLRFVVPWIELLAVSFRCVGFPKRIQRALDVVPLLSLPPGQAHRTAAVTYQSRNIEEGKCSICPMPLARNSVRYCEKHLAACRDRARARAPKRKSYCPCSWSALAIRPKLLTRRRRGRLVKPFAPVADRALRRLGRMIAFISFPTRLPWT